MKAKKSWHARHRMPPGATMEQRIAWHLKHAQACGCRPIPPTVVAALGRNKRHRRKRRK
jgi:hypothetical protein